jgi:hypothetical protein
MYPKHATNMKKKTPGELCISNHCVDVYLTVCVRFNFNSDKTISNKLSAALCSVAMERINQLSPNYQPARIVLLKSNFNQ